MAELKDFVESKLSSAAAEQKRFYDRSSVQRSFKVNDPVWLSIPTAGKLDPKWEGEWKVISIKSPVNVGISNGKQNLSILIGYSIAFCHPLVRHLCQFQNQLSLHGAHLR